MQTIRTLWKFLGLGALVVVDVLRPTRPEYRLPARWLAR
jgi:hypothetical protein